MRSPCHHVIAFLFIFPIILLSQIISHTEVYDNGNIKSIFYHQKVGNEIKKIKCEEFFENGNKYRSGSFKNNRKSGVWIESNQDGKKI